MRHVAAAALALCIVCADDQSAPETHSSPETSRGTEVTLYHFSTASPCRTCPVIDRIVTGLFSDIYAGKTAAGVLEYLPLKMDKPANRHFVDDYRLSGNCLVLSVFKNGRETDWKVLEQVTGLLAGPPADLKAYLRQEIDAVLP